MKRLLLLLPIIIMLTLFAACDSAKEKPKELLLYCGTTMVKPMKEIVAKIEKEENCKIHILKGVSGDLLQSILLNKQGDLYLPGSESYVLRVLPKKYYRYHLCGRK